MKKMLSAWRPPDAEDAASAMTPSSTPPSTPGSAELPPKDGYYWLHNIGREGQHIWRVVEIGFWADGEHRALRRAIRDGQRVYSMAYLATWMGVEFHGPLLPPNVELTHSGKKNP